MTRPPDAPPPGPHLTPTSPSTLVLSALLMGVVGWWLARKFVVPDSLWLPSITLVLLALVEGISARAIKARIDRRPGTEPVDPLFVARLVALAKASSLAGAVFVGLYAGMLVWAATNRDIQFANESLPGMVGGVVASGLLVAAALWLEFACRIPKGPDDPYDDLDNGRDDESVPGL
jgi:hypothetical protein